MDADVLYRMMCDTKIIPKDETGRQVSVGYVCENVVSDGVSASILYKILKKVLDKMENDGIVKKRYTMKDCMSMKFELILV